MKKFKYLILLTLAISNCITHNFGKISYIEIDEKATRPDGNNSTDKVAASSRGYYSLILKELSNQDQTTIGYKNFFVKVRFFNLGEIDFEAEKVKQVNKSPDSFLKKKK